MNAGLCAIAGIFEKEIKPFVESAGFACACGVHEAQCAIVWVEFSGGADVVGRGAVILADEADVAQESEDFEFLIGSEWDEFSAFFEEFDGVDVFVLLGECDGHVGPGGEEVWVDLECVFAVDAGIRISALAYEVDAAFKEPAHAQNIGSGHGVLLVEVEACEAV